MRAGFPAGRAAQWACVLEATAPTPGNVHRGADFEDMSYLDMVLAASLIGEQMQQHGAQMRVAADVTADRFDGLQHGLSDALTIGRLVDR